MISDKIVSVNALTLLSQIWAGLLVSEESEVQLDDFDFVLPKVTALDAVIMPNENPIKFSRNDPVCGKSISNTETLWLMTSLNKEVTANLSLLDAMIVLISFIFAYIPDFAETAVCENQKEELRAVATTFAHVLVEIPAPKRSNEKEPEAGR